MSSKNYSVDYVKSASFIFLEKFIEKYNEDATGILYNKYITLLHRELKKDGIDIGLSHCWYRWGDAVVKYNLPYISWTHDDLDKTTVSFRGNPPTINNDSIIEYSEKFAQDFIDTYDNSKEGVELAVDEVYTEAPFEFQNKYKMLREGLSISRHNTGYVNFNDYILSIFENAMAFFPKEFRAIDKQKEEFSHVFRESVSNNIARSYMFEMAENFWFFFCYYLRINKKCYENVSRETLDIWKKMIPIEKDRYESSIQNYAYEFCPNSKDEVVTTLLKNREQRLSELEKLLAELE